MTTEYLKTKHGNRIFFAKKPKEMSKLRFGIVSNYFDVYARGKDLPFSFDVTIKDLYYSFYDHLFRNYGAPNAAFGYIKSKEVLINAVGGLHAKRYFITDKGKKRLEQLKTLKKARMKAAKKKQNNL